MGRRTQKSSEVAGNTLASQAAFEREMYQAGLNLKGAERVFDLCYDGGTVLASMRVRIPSEDEGEYLIVLKARQEGRAVVGFHAADTFAEAVMGALNRLRNKSIKWRDDEYENQS